MTNSKTPTMSRTESLVLKTARSHVLSFGCAIASEIRDQLSLGRIEFNDAIVALTTRGLIALSLNNSRIEMA